LVIKTLDKEPTDREPIDPEPTDPEPDPDQDSLEMLDSDPQHSKTVQYGTL
jgi:hypothetical protein